MHLFTTIGELREQKKYQALGYTVMTAANFLWGRHHWDDQIGQERGAAPSSPPRPLPWRPALHPSPPVADGSDRRTLPSEKDQCNKSPNCHTASPLINSLKKKSERSLLPKENTIGMIIHWAVVKPAPGRRSSRAAV